MKRKCKKCKGTGYILKAKDMWGSYTINENKEVCTKCFGKGMK